MSDLLLMICWGVGSVGLLIALGALAIYLGAYTMSDWVPKLYLALTIFTVLFVGYGFGIVVALADSIIAYSLGVTALLAAGIVGALESYPPRAYRSELQTQERGIMNSRVSDDIESLSDKELMIVCHLAEVIKLSTELQDTADR